jgi:hypothetical protein
VTTVYKSTGASLVDGFVNVRFEKTKFDFSQTFSMSHIKYFSSNREELEQILSVDKYNI